jgi:DNA mismatch endonuclease, patch repair protein
VGSGSWASSPAIRKAMQANRSRNTQPELALRRALHALGLRYRTFARPLPKLRNTADIVFRPARVAVEVRGCFWHGCPVHYRSPSSNIAYWTEKIVRNRRRDELQAETLRDAGWWLEVVWEHEDPLEASKRVAALVRERRKDLSQGVAGATCQEQPGLTRLI